MRHMKLVLWSFVVGFLLTTGFVASPATVVAAENVPASAMLPMARKGEGITSPSVLATRIRVSLKKDASGNGTVIGANISPNGFLTAVKKAGGQVDGVEALPKYLESLIEREMPDGKITMSRVKYARDVRGTEKFELDVEKGYAREAHKGEKGWYDPNTGYLILAGDCSNSPLQPVKGPTGGSVTPSPTPPAPVPAPVVAPSPSVCEKYLRLNIWENKALDVPGVRATVDETKRDDAGSFFKPNRVSRQFGATFRALNQRGELARSAKDHTVLIVVTKPDETTHVIFSGAVKGGVQEVKLPQDFRDEYVVKVTFAPDSMVSPNKGDLRALGREFLYCTTNLHAIEAR